MSTAAIILGGYLAVGLVVAAVLCSFAYKKGARKGVGILALYTVLFWPIAVIGPLLILIKLPKKDDEL